MDARGKFGEHERSWNRLESSVRVARGDSSVFLSALQTFQVHPQLDIRTAKSMNEFFYNMAATYWVSQKLRPRKLRPLEIGRKKIKEEFRSSSTSRLLVCLCLNLFFF